MTKLVVQYGSITDALGRKREGWLVIEDDRPGYPFASKEEAIKQANAVASIRIVNQVKPAVIVRDRV